MEVRIDRSVVELSNVDIAALLMGLGAFVKANPYNNKWIANSVFSDVGKRLSAHLEDDDNLSEL